MTPKTVIRIIVLVAAFALIWQFTELWVRGAILGFFIGHILNMIEKEHNIITKYENRLKKTIKKGRSNA